ncbi:cytochrome c oxidase assembly protein [Peribacillus sp. FSL M8-0224]|uniref:cytochrome c oxidase assembly protein n=1 Tax=Peribacillus sp. FSL M8-0224 TaxID=2921568 RepID=UPI0030FBD089
MSEMKHTMDFNFLMGWSPFLLLLLICIGGLYLFAIGKRKRLSKFSGMGPVNRLKKFSFLFGIFLFFIAKGSPLNMWGHYLFLIHMLQQSIIYLAVPPLILAGLPTRMVDSILGIWPLRKAWKVFTKPIIAILTFNVLFSFYHIPFIFDAIMSSILWMNVSIVILLPTAFFMWWPVIAPNPAINSMKPLHKIGYIFGMGMLLTPACALIIFSEGILYQTYLNAPRVGVSLLDDQQSGGIVMKILQEVIYGTALFCIFFQWTRDERKKTEFEDKVRLERIKDMHNF